ncbi:MCE family protein [Nocardioides panacisoli]|uniref:MCE family protein n=1 Tax=Nocardioides panacisoli TaxID=627624 RepID=A0ABP7I276_9ACTN
MTEVLFQHSRLEPRVLRLRLAVGGFCGVLALGLVTTVLGLQTLGVLSGDVRLTVNLPTVGDTLGINSDVKYAGLRIGRVVSVDPKHLVAEVLVDPDQAAMVPSDVRARVLPSTLFGNEYVDLVSARPDSDHLADGDVVPADTSHRTLRLMATFSATQHLLASIDPSQWDTALTQLADALDGRGAKIADLMADGDAFLARWERVHPQVRQDLDLLAQDSDLFADAEPQLVSAIRHTRPLARVLVQHQDDTSALLADLPELLDGRDGFTSFLLEHGDAAAQLLDATAANLQVFAERHDAFSSLLAKVPTLLRNGADVVRNGKIQMEGVLSTQFLDPYGPQDCPRYGDLPGRSCGR